MVWSLYADLAFEGTCSLSSDCTCSEHLGENHIFNAPNLAERYKTTAFDGINRIGL